MLRSAAVLAVVCGMAFAQAYRDETYSSKVFSGPRNCRVFLPLSYETSAKRYSVIYYFHGHSDRYTLEAYDKGTDSVPKIADFVRTHDVIVVAMDGYVARHYTGFYGGTPYDVRQDGGDYDFGPAFLELVAHIDGKYRTNINRRHRATSGLSMGGFMSLYLSARYPELIGSASAFNPGPEFYIGEKGRRSLWRPKDHVLSHGLTNIRLIRASGDYISQYHEETRAAYAISPVNFEYRQDEYHRHWATSIGETFAFHVQAFEDTRLDTTPVEWNYTGAFRNFSVRGFDVESDIAGPGLILLEHVRQGSLRVRTRKWAPDGPPAACEALTVRTATLYTPTAEYEIADLALRTGEVAKRRVTAGSDGRLTLQSDCGGHEFAIAGPGTGSDPAVLLPVTSKDFPRFVAGERARLPVRVFNPRREPLSNVAVELTSQYPTVQVTASRARVERLDPFAVVDVSSSFQANFASGSDDWEHARLLLNIRADGMPETAYPIDVLLAPDNLTEPAAIAILDGRSETFRVFRQKGNQGGGGSIERAVTEGAGNGNGRLDPGEEATVWLRLNRGLDAFDRGNWCRAKVYTDSAFVSETADIQEQKQLEWTSAQNRTSRIRLSPDTPANEAIPLILDCESWSYHFTPDVRYGVEPLYQAFQLHKHHLFRVVWKPGATSTTKSR